MSVLIEKIDDNSSDEDISVDKIIRELQQFENIFSKIFSHISESGIRDSKGGYWKKEGNHAEYSLNIYDRAGIALKAVLHLVVFPETEKSDEHIKIAGFLDDEKQSRSSVVVYDGASGEKLIKCYANSEYRPEPALKQELAEIVNDRHWGA
jgi:hypothetical protein